MCGRFVSARKRLELLAEFAVTRDAVGADRDPDYNVAPTKRVYAVLEREPKPPEANGNGKAGKDEAGKDKSDRGDSGKSEQSSAKPERELTMLRWGLVPSWAKDTSGSSRLINARSETVAVKPSFRSAFAKRRCLLPADGYYEWVTEGKAKKPFYIHRLDGGILAFAGLYEFWRNKAVPEDHEDAWYQSVTVITTQATDEVGKIHDRTPMIITPDSWADWLDPDNHDKDSLHAIMQPAMLSGADGLATYPVSTAVNSVRNNGPSLIEPLDTVPPGGGAASKGSLLF